MRNLRSPSKSEITAEASRLVAAAPEEVWRALTTPASLKAFFFGADVESNWRAGDPIRMRGEFNGAKYEDKGEILTAEVGKRLAFSHWSALSGTADSPENYHVVTFELTPDPAGTSVRLTQSNLTGGVKPSDRENRAEYEKNWRGVLDGLAKVLNRR